MNIQGKHNTAPHFQGLQQRGAGQGRECSGWPVQDSLTHHILPCVPWRGCCPTEHLEVHKHPDTAQPPCPAEGRWKGRSPPCTALITSRRLLGCCSSARASNLPPSSTNPDINTKVSHGHQHKEGEEEGMETVGSCSSEGHGLMGSHTQGSSSSSVGSGINPQNSSGATSKGNTNLASCHSCARARGE